MSNVRSFSSFRSKVLMCFTVCHLRVALTAWQHHISPAGFWGEAHQRHRHLDLAVPRYFGPVERQDLGQFQCPGDARCATMCNSNLKNSNAGKHRKDLTLKIFKDIYIYISLSIFGLSLRGVGISLGGVGPLDPLSEGSGPSFKLKRGVARGHEGSWGVATSRGCLEGGFIMF